eukprot:216735_1
MASTITQTQSFHGMKASYVAHFRSSSMYGFWTIRSWSTFNRTVTRRFRITIGAERFHAPRNLIQTKLRRFKLGDFCCFVWYYCFIAIQCQMDGDLRQISVNLVSFPRPISRAFAVRFWLCFVYLHHSYLYFH